MTWDDVRGDYVAARAAALVMRQAAATMEHLRAQRQALGQSALEQWSGRYASEFVDRLEHLQRESRELQAQLLAAARRLEQAADDAATEQRSRVVARAAWAESVRAATGGPPVPGSLSSRP